MKYILGLILLFVRSEVEAQKKVRIDYIGFYQDVLEKNRVTLDFELRNLTHDTIYLSEILNLIAYKNGKKIKKEKINNGIGTPFV
jgi:hypothetical protein